MFPFLRPIPFIMRSIVSISIACCFHTSLLAAALQGLGPDADARSNGTVASSTSGTLIVGATGSPIADSSSIIVFQLPNFGSVAAPFTSASLRLNITAKSGTPANVDLYGLGRRAAATVLASDYYGQSTTADPTDATILQGSILSSATAVGRVYTSTSGATSLMNYLNAQYANGAGAGQHVFLRLSSRASSTSAANYSISSANAASNGPRLIYNIPSGTTRPFIWVRDSEKAGILAKIANNAWATSVHNGMIARVAADLASHQSNRDTFLRRLPVVNWTDATPRLKTIPAYEESTVRFILAQMLNDAQDCAVLYYLTGDAKYARCAADILHNTIKTILPVTASTSTGNGGWIFQTDLLKEARVNAIQMPIIYDFLYSWLQTNQVYDVKAAGMVNFNFTNAQSVFRKYYQLIRDHGQTESNWSALEAPSMLHNLLALDSASERNAAVEVYLTAGSSRQASLDYDYRHYETAGNIWPESLQYASAVGNIRTQHLVMLERYNPALNLFDRYPNFPTSLPRISFLRYPNGEQISFGDGHRESGGQPYSSYELVYQHAQAIGDTRLTSLFGSLLNGGQAAGEYNRSVLQEYENLGSMTDPLQILWQVPTIAEPSVFPELPRTDTLPYAGVSLQRNEAPSGDPNYGLMCFVGGAGHIHSHASGMSMELYGAGEVMGAKSGRTDYGSTNHENYYRVFAANNTVIVNGGSRGEGGWQNIAINTVQNVAMEPRVSAAPVSPDYSFTCSSFADDKGTLAEGTQQRTMAIVRTSPTTGYYVDFFRTRSTVTNRTATTLNGNVTNQYHDYIYRNIGDSAVEMLADGAPLTLTSQVNRFANDTGDEYDQPGWRYFTNTAVSLPTNQSFRAKFKATVSGTPRYMSMHMPAVANREYAKVDSPAIVDAPAPYNSRLAPTLVIRQIGEAWEKAFATVYEPHMGSSAGSVQNDTQLLRGNVVVGVKVESNTGTRNVIQYIFSNPNSTETYTNTTEGINFKGRFGIASSNGDGSVTLYLGEGSSMTYRGNTVATVSGSNSQAQVRFTPGLTPEVTANAAVNVTPAPAPPGNTWVPTIAGTYDWNTVTNWSPANSPNSVGHVARKTTNLTGNQIVNLNVPITLGELAIGDSTGSQTTLLRRGTNGSLTFDQVDNEPTYLTRTAGGTGNITLASDLNITLNDDLIVRNATGTNHSVIAIEGAISGNGKTLAKESSNLTLVLSAANTYSGATKLIGGILSLNHSLALQNSAFDSNLSLSGTATEGLQTTVNSLTLGGISGTKNFSSLFTTNASGLNSLTNLTLNVGTSNLVFSGVIADGSPGMAFTKAGSGTQTLSAIHTYTGATTLSANGGILEISGNGSLGAGNYSSAIALGANSKLHFSSSATQTLAGSISGTGTLQKSHATSTLTLSGTNSSFSGTVDLDGGTLSLANANALSAATAIQLANATTLSPIVQTVTVNAPIAVSGTPIIQAPDFGSGSTSSTLSLNGSITGSGNVTFGANASIASNAQQTIRLNATSSYSGGTTTLHPTHSNANLIVRLGIANALPISTILAVNGSNGSGTGRVSRFDLNGFHQTIGGLQNTPASLRSQSVISDAATPAILTIQNSTNRTFSGSVNGTGLSLVKNGTGRQTLAGINGFSGDTTINAGILQGVVGGSFTNSAITLANANGTLGVAISDATKTWTCPSLHVAATGNLEFSFGTVQPASVAPLTVTGAVAFQATPTVRIVTDSGIPSGTYPLMTWSSSSGSAPTVVSIVNSSGKSALVDGTTASLSATATRLNLIITSVPTIVKANNSNNLNLGTSWVGGTAPNFDKTATWNNTVTAANTTVLGANTTWAGITVSNPGGNVTINAGHSLTLGANATDIGMNAATSNLTLNCPLILGDDNTWNVTASRTLTLGGVVSGAFPITKEGSGTALLTAANTFNGDIVLAANAGSFDIGGTGTLGTGNFVGAIEIGNGSTFRYNSSTAQTLSGALRGSGTLRKENSSLLTLAAANPDFAGTISLHQGRIDLANLDALGATTAIQTTGASTLSSSLDGMTTAVPVILGSNFSLAFGRTTSARGTMRFNGPISGIGTMTFTTVTNNSGNNLQTLFLGAQHSYTGNTIITTANAGNTFSVRATQADVLPVTTVLTIDGGNGSGTGRTISFDLNGFDQTLAGLTNVTGLTLRSQRIFNSSGQTATLTINNTSDFSFSGSITGSDLSLNKIGSGMQTLAAANTYDGVTSVGEGLLVLGHSLALQNSCFDTSESVLGDDTNGIRSTVTTLTVGGLRGSRNFSTNFTTSSGGYSSVTALTLNPVAGVSCDYSGVIANGAPGMSLTKSGAGTQILSGANTYSGGTVITAGTLRLGANNVLPATPVSLGDATLDVAGFSDTVGTLDLAGNATIQLLPNGTLAFAASNAVDWTDHSATPAALTISGAFVSGSSLRFGTTNTALTPAQLALISAEGFGPFSLNSSGYLTATRLTSYANWAGAHANNQAAHLDFDKDGVANGIEYLLGGTSATNDIAKLPTLSTTGGDRVFRFIRSHGSMDPNNTVTIQTSENLHDWPNSHNVPDEEGTTPAGITVEKNAPAVGQDTITFILPSSATETFVRLKISVP